MLTLYSKEERLKLARNLTTDGDYVWLKEEISSNDLITSRIAQEIYERHKRSFYGLIEGFKDVRVKLLHTMLKKNVRITEKDILERMREMSPRDFLSEIPRLVAHVDLLGLRFTAKDLDDPEAYLGWFRAHGLDPEAFSTNMNLLELFIAFGCDKSPVHWWGEIDMLIERGYVSRPQTVFVLMLYAERREKEEVALIKWLKKINEETPIRLQVSISGVALIPLLLSLDRARSRGPGTGIRAEYIPSIAKKLIRGGADIDAGPTPALVTAVANKEAYLAKRLLELGADPFVSDSNGRDAVETAKLMRKSKIKDKLLMVLSNAKR